MSGNLCRACGALFASLDMFVRHRATWKVVREHSVTECTRLCASGRHKRGECQRLVGHCTKPQDLGLFRADDGAWYTAAGLRQHEQRAARIAQVRADVFAA